MWTLLVNGMVYVTHLVVSLKRGTVVRARYIGHRASLVVPCEGRRHDCDGLRLPRRPAAGEIADVSTDCLSHTQDIRNPVNKVCGQRQRRYVAATRSGRMRPASVARACNSQLNQASCFKRHVWIHTNTSVICPLDIVRSTLTSGVQYEKNLCVDAVGRVLRKL